MVSNKTQVKSLIDSFQKGEQINQAQRTKSDFKTGMPIIENQKSSRDRYLNGL